MKVVYVEKKMMSHFRVEDILSRLGRYQVIPIDHYGQVFNRKGQSFRTQKKKPALILAEKKGRRVLPTPEGFGIGGTQNFYFSHMLNCLYDCQYCFLQGMYSSAHHLLFVNYEDFMVDLEKAIRTHPGAYFFSGYDGDSLAFEPISGFVESFLAFFKKHPDAVFELRTKSTQIDALMANQPLQNTVVAFSLTPDTISKAIEKGVPALHRRLQAMKRLADQGWMLGLRFDPLIWADDFEKMYAELIANVFQFIQPTSVHSVSVGGLRFPKGMHQKLTKMHPQEPLFAHPLYAREGTTAYRPEREKLMKQSVIQELNRFLPSTVLFECQPW